MKKNTPLLTTLLLALCLASEARAQQPATPQQPEQESCQHDTSSCSSNTSVVVGFSAGVTLFGNGNDMSPYYSKYGLLLHVPIVLQHDFDPHWRLSSGLRFDFHYDPLYHTVKQLTDAECDPIGIGFDNFPVHTQQHGHAFRAFLGIPLELTWYPKANNHHILSLGVDFFAGYAIAQHFFLKDETYTITGTHVTGLTSEDSFSDPSMSRWKMELGLTLGTDYIGLIHGVRLFGDLLPRYKDPVTGEKIYCVGLTFYL